MAQKRYDLLIAVLVFVVQLPMLAFITLQNHCAMFGAEYGDIAASVLEGHGYANAIIPRSEVATAWMLPGVVGLLVVVFWLFGVKTTAAAYALMLLT
jgi:hypothetical protein